MKFSNTFARKQTVRSAMIVRLHDDYTSHQLQRHAWWMDENFNNLLRLQKTFPWNVSLIRPWKFLFSFTRLLIFLCHFYQLHKNAFLAFSTKHIVSNNEANRRSKMCIRLVKILAFYSCYDFPLFKGLWGFCSLENWLKEQRSECHIYICLFQFQLSDTDFFAISAKNKSQLSASGNFTFNLRHCTSKIEWMKTLIIQKKENLGFPPQMHSLHVSQQQKGKDVEMRKSWHKIFE